MFDAIISYWEAPSGRGSEHLVQVMDAALSLVGRPLTQREWLTMMLHDIGVGRKGWSRDDHPLAALDAIDNDEGLADIRPLVDDEMRDAIRLHMRDQYSGLGFVSPLHQLLIEADEGRPVWGQKRIEKPVKYWLDGRNKAIPVDAPLEKVVSHVTNVILRKIDDFNSGRSPFTQRYRDAFADDIKSATDWARSVRSDDVVECIERLRNVT